MSRNFKQFGDTLPVAVPYAAGVVAGDGVKVGSLFGVAGEPGAQNETVHIQRVGVFELKKTGTQAWTRGDDIFWDDTNREATTVSTGNFPIGVAAADVGGGAGDTLGDVLLGAPHLAAAA